MFLFILLVNTIVISFILYFFTSIFFAINFFLFFFSLLILFWIFLPHFEYYSKLWGYYFVFIFTTFYLIPIYLIRPFTTKNLQLTFKQWRFFMNFYSIKIEIRNKERLLTNQSTVYISNHQSSFDMFPLASFCPPNTTLLAKKEILYLGWFGLAAFFSDVIFINRFNHSRAVNKINEVAETINKKKTNIWIYPEGTRSTTGKILPFKKGAFHLAVEAQAPIIPFVVSSYKSFIDHKTKTFKSGRIICQVLEKIETKGKTSEDVNDLMEQSHKAMDQSFESLNRELGGVGEAGLEFKLEG